MTDLTRVLLLALLPPAGNFAGGMVAEALPRSAAWLNRALHVAAGVVIAVVAVEIFPGALDAAPAWILGVAFLLGGGLYLLAEWLVQNRLATAGDGAGRMWMIYLAVATDLFGDGLMIGAGTSVAAALGLVLALGQVLADVPEGFASIFTFKANGIARRQRILLSASFALPALAGALIAYVTLRTLDDAVQYAALVGTAGLFAVAAFEDMIREAHETADDSRVSTLFLIGGFTLFVFVSAGLG